MIGGGNAEKDPKIVKYVCDQMEEGIRWLERVTGREFSDELFIKAAQKRDQGAGPVGQHMCAEHACPRAVG